MKESINQISGQPDSSEKKRLDKTRSEILEKRSFVEQMCKKILTDFNQADIEGIASEALFKAYEHAEQYKEEAALETWLGRIATNEALMFLRKTKIEPSASNSAKPIDDDKNPLDIEDNKLNPEEILLKKEQLEIINAGMETLTPNQARILKLSINRKNGQTNEDIAREIDIPVFTFKSTLLRAKRKLAEYFKSQNERVTLNQMVSEEE